MREPLAFPTRVDLAQSPAIQRPIALQRALSLRADVIEVPGIIRDVRACVELGVAHVA
jgi:hypothetical protein